MQRVSSQVPEDPWQVETVMLPFAEGDNEYSVIFILKIISHFPNHNGNYNWKPITIVATTMQLQVFCKLLVFICFH